MKRTSKVEEFLKKHPEFKPVESVFLEQHPKLKPTEHFTLEKSLEQIDNLPEDVAEFERATHLKAIWGYDLGEENDRWWKENGTPGVARVISLNRLAWLNNLYGLSSGKSLSGQTLVDNPNDVIGIRVVGRDDIQGLVNEMGRYNEHGIIVDDIELYDNFNGEPEMVITFNINNGKRFWLNDYAEKSEKARRKK